MRATETARAVQIGLQREEERLKTLMEDYQRTLSQLDQKPPTPYKRATLTDILVSPTKANLSDIPSYKRAFVLPSIESILQGVDAHIEEQEFLIQDARENVVKLRQEYLLRETRIDRF